MLGYMATSPITYLSVVCLTNVFLCYFIRESLLRLYCHMFKSLHLHTAFYCVALSSHVHSVTKSVCLIPLIYNETFFF